MIDIKKKYKTKNGYEADYVGESSKIAHPYVFELSRGDIEPFLMYFSVDGICPDYSEYDLIEFSSFDNWNIDDELIITTFGNEWIKAHYAGGGKYYPVGKSSFTYSLIACGVHLQDLSLVKSVTNRTKDETITL